ncbi:putative regulator of chromosome condensation -like protein [Erysiphe neolycopersici]|uniref:Putative regulator of chromosome condensation-like protein n=1 Tax=Erysiphe neolycopersici TaxID=212602 RepID=A0A420HFK5_9PEZI|nr:putative regulator of chromosome condensation -like protein [Erysiphe neolycopersici]
MLIAATTYQHTPLMSINPYDNPPGSESDQETASRIVGAILNGIQPAHEISPSGELYRVIGRHHRLPRTALYASDILSQPNTGNMSPDQDINARRAGENESELSPLFVLPLSDESSELPISSRSGPGSSIRGQSRLVRPYLNRLFNRNRSALRENVHDSYSELQRAGHQLDQASSNLRALINDPVPDIATVDSEAQPDIRRIKRRKLISDNLDTTFTGFSYGKYGQVEPGKLKMEIVSCDGGIFEGTDVQHPAENVLENDNTVYCTKSNRCNLILRHQGATVFCLKELYIRAPHTGYTAPVQEGMVFISMTSDDLLARTAQYQIQYSPLRPEKSFRSPADLRNDNQRIMSFRFSEDEPMTLAHNRIRRLFDIGRQDEECDHRTAQIPQDFTPENAPPFSVTTECSDSDSDDSSARPSNQRYARLGISFASSDDSDSYEEDESHFPWREISNQLTNSMNRRRRPPQPIRNATIPSTTNSPFIPSQEHEKNVEGGLMAPHARFFIERDKSKCTVKFDPPVSGRFILLKMWSPHHDVSGNIDIQSVVAIGFAGPRYFPAIKQI